MALPSPSHGVLEHFEAPVKAAKKCAICHRAVPVGEVAYIRKVRKEYGASTHARDTWQTMHLTCSRICRSD